MPQNGKRSPNNIDSLDSHKKKIKVEDNPSFSTKSIHVAQEPEQVHGSVVTPIHLSSTFAQKEPGVMYGDFDYSRCGNPTRDALEKVIASIFIYSLLSFFYN